MSITLINKPKVLTYNKNTVNARFVFTEVWEGIKVAVFKVDNVAYEMILEEDDTCEIPEEMYTSTTHEFSVGLLNEDSTTDEVKIKYDKSCYQKNVTVSNPTPDIFTQLLEEINKLKSCICSDPIEPSEPSNPTEVTTEYNITNKFSYCYRLQDYNSNGEVVSGQCIVTTTNVDEFKEIPFGGIIRANNEYYVPSQVLSNVDGHVIFSERFYNTCNEANFVAFFSLVSGDSWQAGMVLRLILASPNANEVDKVALTPRLKGNKDVIVLGEEYFTSSNVQNNANLSRVTLAQDIWSKAIIDNEVYIRNGYTVHFQFRGEWVGATVKFDTELTNLTTTFNMKKFYDVETGEVVPMVI